MSGRPTPRIFLTGDSGTAGRRRDEAPLAGWGQALPLFLRDVQVVDSARPGASSRTFVESGGLAAVLARVAPGDLLLACFGLNDVYTDGLGEWSAVRWRRAGDLGSRAFSGHLEPGEHPAHPDGLRDNTHLRERGAVACARCVACELNRQGLLTPEYFRDLDAPVPPDALPHAEFPDDLGLR